MASSDEADAAYATLDAALIDELTPHGEVRALPRGTVLYEAGSDPRAFYIVLEGTAEIVRPGDDEVRIVSWGARAFLGELNLLTGQRALMTARMATDGRILEIPLATFRHLMSTHPELSDIVFQALLARRAVLRGGDGASAIRIVGSRFSRDALALRSFANRSRLPHTWIDLDDLDDPDVFLANLGVRPADVPVVLTPTGRLLHPSPGVLAEHLGLSYRPRVGLFDLAVVGSGPAGLAAAVYGASEGLDTISLDAIAIGGQAGTSSRIENYVGFPNGVSGDELAGRAAAQAFRLGARLNAPCEVTGIRAEAGFQVLELADGTELPTRAVLIASGARYRRLPVDDLDRFEGAGVYYAATELEVRTCSGAPVLVVGGGNSAGQAAIFLAQHGATVTVVIRGDDLRKSMSQYLIERIDESPAIAVRCETEVRRLHGDTRLEQVDLVTAGAATSETVPCAGLFSFIGAVPATEWLSATVALDPRGFILTDRALTDKVALDRDPFPYETSQPGIFAAGDVRHDSMKRVAAAVGEGSSAVRSVHDYLATIST
jgi:thioredoxin reductase (NADPH)